jgi:hypothetical protein
LRTAVSARPVSKAADGTSDLASNIDAVARTIDATGRAAKNMLGAAGQLSKHAAALRDKVAGFLNVAQATQRAIRGAEGPGERKANTARRLRHRPIHACGPDHAQAGMESEMTI